MKDLSKPTSDISSNQDILALAKNIPAKRPGTGVPLVTMMKDNAHTTNKPIRPAAGYLSHLLPNNMLNEFGTLRGALKIKMPAMEMGILFREPTRLQ